MDRRNDAGEPVTARSCGSDRQRDASPFEPEIDQAVEEWRTSSSLFAERDVEGPSESSLWIG